MIRFIINFLLIKFFQLSQSFIKKENIIILHSHDYQSYKSNTKYLFEYFSKYLTDYKVYYVTENEEIQKYIKNNNMKYITIKNRLTYLLTAVKSIFIINAGTNFFNPYNISLDKKVIKICTMHGNSPKTIPTTFDTFEKNMMEFNNFNAFDYINFNNDYCGMKIGRRNFRLPKQKIITLGSPQCDQYFDKNIVNKKYKKKLWSKKLNYNFNSDAKVILYTPTWRPYDYPIPLKKLDDFNWNDFNYFLEKNNAFFYYSLHSMQNYQNQYLDLIYENTHIKFIDENYFNMYDPNEFLNEVDCLINDYSNISTDFALLNRPQLFVIPDYDEYDYHKGFIEDYKSLMPGYTVNNFNELSSSILECIFKPDIYLDKYKNIQSNLLHKYYNIKNTNSCESFLNFIKYLNQ